MPEAKGLSRNPPRSRTLKSVRGARSELCRLYAEVRKGEVDPTVAGRLCQILAILLASTKSLSIRGTARRLEARLAGTKPNGRRTIRSHEREAERRLHLLEGTVLARYPAPDPPASELECWAATLSDDVLMRIERLFRAMADDPERDDHPMSELERRLIECACLDAAFDDADPCAAPTSRASRMTRASPRWQSCGNGSSAGSPALSGSSCAAPTSAAGSPGTASWSTSLVAGELVRLAALLKVFEGHPIEARHRVHRCALGCDREHGHRKRHGMG